MNKNHILFLSILVVWISACSGGDVDTSALESQIAALESQVSELEGQLADAEAMAGETLASIPEESPLTTHNANLIITPNDGSGTFAFKLPYWNVSQGILDNNDELIIRLTERKELIKTQADYRNNEFAFILQDDHVSPSSIAIALYSASTDSIMIPPIPSCSIGIVNATALSEPWNSFSITSEDLYSFPTALFDSPDRPSSNDTEMYADWLLALEPPDEFLDRYPVGAQDIARVAFAHTAGHCYCEDCGGCPGITGCMPKQVISE